MSDNRVVANPFRTEQSGQLKQTTAATDVAVQRELAEVQAAVIMARRFPRDPMRAMDVILQACTRPGLAQDALYSFSRGGNEISGPSIRLAEVLSQNWGNLAFGVRELEQRPGESTMEAYCWDMETNVRQSRVFQVGHVRQTKGGRYALTDPRDIYEQNANQGARRLRACILGVIPGDVVEAAVQQCEMTLKTAADISPDGLKKLVEAFAPFGVTREMIEVRCQRRLDTIRPAQVVQLRKIYASLRDEMSEPRDWFDMPQQHDEPPATGTEALRQKLAPEEPAERRLPTRDTAVPASTPESPQEPAETFPSPASAGDAIEELKPVRKSRGGWDWAEYTDRYIALGTSLPRERLGEFRGVQASMFDILHASNKELWARANQALSEYEGKLV